MINKADFFLIAIKYIPNEIIEKYNVIPKVKIIMSMPKL